MKFKIDENLPLDIARALATAGHDALMITEQGLGGASDARVAEVCRSEARALVTFDLDFADMRTYPPNEHSGLIVLRVSRQDRAYVLSVFRQILPVLESEPLEGRLWIVEENRIRIRGE